MQKIKIETILEVFDSVSELPDTVQKVMNKAHEAREQAYAPYSRFRVGTAILLENGEIITGNNQENAAFPSGLCAERVAAFQAGSNFPGVGFDFMTLTAGSANQQNSTPIPPCGACRQALAEYEVRQDNAIPIYFMGKSGKVYKSASVRDLLPLIFDHSYLDNSG